MNALPPFDPADFDRRLNALLTASELQRKAIAEAAERSREEDERLSQQIKALLDIATSQSASIDENATAQKASIHELAETVREQGRQLAVTERLVREMVEGINRLANVAEVHGEVIDDHEDRLNRIEGQPPNGTATPE